MNKYALTAQRYLERARPQERWLDESLAELGEQIAQQVEARELSLTNWQNLPHGHLERIGALNAIKAQAEEEALNDLLYQPYPPIPDADDQTETAPTHQLLSDLQNSLNEIRQANLNDL